MPTRDSADQRLATVLRGLRESRGSTQEEIAHAAGLTISSYGEIERGKANPAWTTVERIAHALGVTLGELAQATEAVEGAEAVGSAEAVEGAAG